MGAGAPFKARRMSRARMYETLRSSAFAISSMSFTSSSVNAETLRIVRNVHPLLRS